MMHPFAGHAAMAAETPPENRSANRMFERFCILTVPLVSDICEFTRDAGPENFGTVFMVPLADVTAAAIAALDKAPALAPDPVTAADVVLEVVGTVEGTLRTEAPVPAFANAEAGNPPNVVASPAFKAYGTLTSNILGCSSSPGSSVCTPNQRDSPDVNNSIGIPKLPVAPSITS